MMVMIPLVILSLFLLAKTVIFKNLSMNLCPSLLMLFILFCFSDYTSFQLFLSCGQEVTIYSKPVGYRDNGPPAFALAVSYDFSVKSWTNELEDDFLKAQVYNENNQNDLDSNN